MAGVLRVKQSYVSLLEADERCPELALALIIQAVSEGAVPATAWGYSEDEVARVLAAGAYPGDGAMVDEGAPAPAPDVSSATATAIDGTPSLAAAEHKREPATRTRSASTSRRRSTVDPRAA